MSTQGVIVIFAKSSIKNKRFKKKQNTKKGIANDFIL